MLVAITIFSYILIVIVCMCWRVGWYGDVGTARATALLRVRCICVSLNNDIVHTPYTSNYLSHYAVMRKCSTNICLTYDILDVYDMFDRMRNDCLC